MPNKAQWLELLEKAGLKVLKVKDVTKFYAQFCWERYEKYVNWAKDPNAE